jgi:hypothetical protein
MSEIKSTWEKVWNEYKDLSLADKKNKILSIIDEMSKKGFSCEKTYNYISNTENVSESYLDEIYKLIMEPLTNDFDEKTNDRIKITSDRIQKLEELSEIQQKKDKEEAEELLNSIY